MAARFEGSAARWKWRFCTRTRKRDPSALPPSLLLDIRAASLPAEGKRPASAQRTPECVVSMSLEYKRNCARSLKKETSMRLKKKNVRGDPFNGLNAYQKKNIYIPIRFILDKKAKELSRIFFFEIERIKNGNLKTARGEEQRGVRLNYFPIDGGLHSHVSCRLKHASQEKKIGQLNPTSVTRQPSTRSEKPDSGRHQTS